MRSKIEKKIFDKLARRLRDQGFEVKRQPNNSIEMQDKLISWHFRSMHNFIFGTEDDMSVFQAAKYFIGEGLDDVFLREMQRISAALDGLEPFSSYEELLLKLEITGE